ncbi:von Willebrand factor type A domain-containing protein [Roridomyces roridus]|uniref:von Willebrand factor type A domain-containing protein n=1 Tax=Roridomyces roridus TaxID=1738132 RepID=A0AAD7BFH8_9AGAR|nr:von Willebrand factor type A domain-containing protein [Roridomyces roridus]
MYGLYYFFENRQVSLPLLNVRAEASIKELAAQVKLTQTYGNDATFPIEAKFSFPIPARAVVVAFCMIKQDGTRIVGSVMEKQEAKETYDTAVSQGQQASLMEQQTPDVFQVSVGNIPSREQVQIELVYATELTEDEENDQIRFHLPVHIGARYGSPPQSGPSPFASTPPQLQGSSVLQLRPVSLASESALEKDFVLTIKSAGLDTPRCVAELHPSNDTVAVGLTLVPRFKLPDLSRQEFVFLVDRSGSMSRNRIEAAKKALVVMLRALPHQDSLFQIASFGSHHSFLWESGSKAYNQVTLEEATHHVDKMQADFGGTEIRGALESCFKARKLDRPMSLLVLTDGDAWDLDGVLAEVKSAVASAPANAYLRVSVLGIGNSASTAMCEGMARVGNGTCMMVGEQETSFTGKIARMLKAARTPPISNISVDWGRPVTKAEKVVVADDDDFEMVEETSEKPKKTLNIFDETVDDLKDMGSTPAPPPPPVVLPPPAAVQQAPFKVRNLFPNIRLKIYAILQGKNVPQTVTIRGSTADGSEIALPITVTLSNLPNAPGAPPAVHALAARKIIQDLEDGQHELASLIAKPDDIDLLARTVKASIISLGKAYSIASSHTSFVAVDESKPAAPVGQAVHLVSGIGGPVLMFATAPPPAPASLSIRSRSSASYMGFCTNAPSGASGFQGRGSAGGLGRGGVSYIPPATRAMDRDRCAPSRSSAPLPAAAPYAAAPMPPPPPGGIAFQYSGGFERAKAMPQSKPKLKASYYLSNRISPNLPAAPTDLLEALARLQTFDGAFTLDVLQVVKLASGIDIEAVREVFPAGAADAAVTTVLAMAFLSAKLGVDRDRDEWEGIHDKAKQYVEAALSGMNMDELEAKVVGMLA